MNLQYPSKDARLSLFSIRLRDKVQFVSYLFFIFVFSFIFLLFYIKIVVYMFYVCVA